MEKVELTFRQQMTVLLGFLAAVFLFVWPPSFIPQSWARFLGPVIGWNIVYWAQSIVYKKEFDRLANSQDKVYIYFRWATIAIDLLFLIIAGLFLYLNQLVGANSWN